MWMEASRNIHKKKRERSWCRRKAGRCDESSSVSSIIFIGIGGESEKKRIRELNATDDDLHSQKFIDDDSVSLLLIFLLDKRHIYLPIDYGNRIYGTWIYIFFSFSFCVSVFSAHSLSQFSTIIKLVDDKRNCHDRYINTCLEFEFKLSFSCCTNENTHSPVSYRPCPAIRHMHTHFEQRSLLKGNYSLIGKQHVWFSEKMIHPLGAVDYDSELRLHKTMRVESPFPKRLKTSLDVDNGQRVKTTTRRRGGRKKRRANQRTFVHLLDMLIASEKRCDMLLELRLEEQKRASNGLFCVQMDRSPVRDRLSEQTNSRRTKWRSSKHCPWAGWSRMHFSLCPSLDRS